jgi:hypothetical protein
LTAASTPQGRTETLEDAYRLMVNDPTAELPAELSPETLRALRALAVLEDGYLAACELEEELIEVGFCGASDIVARARANIAMCVIAQETIMGREFLR